MNIGEVTLAVTLILWAIIGMNWVSLDIRLVFILALISGAIKLLEQLGLMSWSVPAPLRRRQKTEA